MDPVMPAASAVDPDALDYFGEDGQWLAAQGHLDLAAFTTAADARARADDPTLGHDELPSAYGEAYHTWFRTMTREWFDRNSGWRECDEATKARRFAEAIAEGALEPCSAEATNAEAWTLIATGA